MKTFSFFIPLLVWNHATYRYHVSLFLFHAKIIFITSEWKCKQNKRRGKESRFFFRDKKEFETRDINVLRL